MENILHQFIRLPLFTGPLSSYFQHLFTYCKKSQTMKYYEYIPTYSTYIIYYRYVLNMYTF